MVDSNIPNINICMTNNKQIKDVNNINLQTNNISNNNVKEKLLNHIFPNWTDDINKNIINLDRVSKTYEIPKLFETWNWVGDTSVLPYKFLELFEKSNFISIRKTQNIALKDIKDITQNIRFNKDTFYFLTCRSETAACIYLDLNNNYDKSTGIIRYLLVNEKYNSKYLEQSLLTIIIKLSKKLNLKHLYFDQNTSIYDYEYISSILY